jgi:hypothetical protein
VGVSRIPHQSHEGVIVQKARLAGTFLVLAVLAAGCWPPPPPTPEPVEPTVALVWTSLLQVGAGSGAHNRVVVWDLEEGHPGGAFGVRDDGAEVVASHGCVQVTPHEAHCTGDPWNPITEVRVHLGDLDDVATIHTAHDNVWVHGHEGSDLLVGGPTGNKLLGGPGDDFLIGGGGTNFLHGGPGTQGGPGFSGHDRIDARNGEIDLAACDDGEAWVDPIDVPVLCDVVHEEPAAG